MASRKRTSKKGSQAKGDCYEAAANYILRSSNFYIDGEKTMGDVGKADGLLVVHAEVYGQGPMDGFRFGHGFIVDTKSDIVLDLSNGRNIRLPKALYYAIGGVEEIGNYYEYTPFQVFENMKKYRHYGPWDLKTSSGL